MTILCGYSTLNVDVVKECIINSQKPCPADFVPEGWTPPVAVKSNGNDKNWKEMEKDPYGLYTDDDYIYFMRNRRY